ncbi:uncharacterized protein DNG_05373 [Cephalotrichum gorgonifer]|uniref:Uncharacterized protein n=1 Tax=Cephalotrichum gorgonifer TaxID=2041049 RepID=A0AAE8SVE8_9PEZI|nr:uncharacterized protein DNG_05373 [Cephalotrichum gorgonifer]
MDIISPSAGRLRRPRTSTRGDDQKWTAAKCLRLLRPIHVRIGNLRQIAADSAVPAQIVKPRKPRFLRTDGDKHSLSDDEWNPSANKRARVTYAQRKRKASRHSDPGQSRDSHAPIAPKTTCRAPCGPITPGKLLITTPLIRRMKGSILSPHSPSDEPSAQSFQEPHPGATTKPGLSYLQQDIESLRSIHTATQVRHEEALLQALDALLRHAASQAVGSTGSKGSNGGCSKSLVAMCLRQAPRQLRRIEEWDAQEAERRGAKTTLTACEAMPEMYQQMESMGHEEAGWRPLRHMVRGHATNSVTEAIADGVIDFSLTKLVVKLFLHWQCFDEVSTLLESLLLQQYPQAGCQEDVPSPTYKLVEPLSYVINLCAQHGWWSTLFHMLSRLVSDDRISGEWLCTKAFEPVWASLSRRLVSGGQLCPWTLKFFHRAIWSLACFPVTAPTDSPGRPVKGVRQAGPWQMFVSTVGAVTAMGLMSLSRGGGGDNGIYRSVLYAMEGSLAELVTRTSSRTLQHRSLLELGVCAVSCAGKRDNLHESPARLPTGAGTHYARGAEASRRLYEGAVSLICSIAQHCSRGSPLAPHQHFLSICSSMANVTLMGRSMADVEKDGAFILAQRTSDLRDLAFAESRLPTKGHQKSASQGCRTAGSVSSESDETDAASAATTLYSGWKWEEGISEWIVRTPAPVQVSTRAPDPTKDLDLPSSPTPAAQKPSREILALKTRFGRFVGESQEAKGQTRKTKPRSVVRVRPATRHIRGVEVDYDSSSEDEMAREKCGGCQAGDKFTVRNPKLSARPVSRTQTKTKTRRKVVRKISSWGGLGSSDDELLL